jgi:hypothetical protein
MIELLKQSGSKTILKITHEALVVPLILTLSERYFQPEKELTLPSGTVVKIQALSKAEITIEPTAGVEFTPLVGMARCSSTDRFSRTGGWKAALQNALSGEDGRPTFDKPTREVLWTEFWKVFPTPQNIHHRAKIRLVS